MRRTIKDILSCGLFPNSLKINSLFTNNITTPKFEHHFHSNIKSKLEPSIIWEDNQGCIYLANDPLKNRPRTKHISIKWHRFRDEIKKGNIKITKIHKSSNISDILRKPLVTSKFIGLQKFLMGR
jgi:virulence-associated protein VapD